MKDDKEGLIMVMSYMCALAIKLGISPKELLEIATGPQAVRYMGEMAAVGLDLILNKKNEENNNHKCVESPFGGDIKSN